MSSNDKLRLVSGSNEPAQKPPNTRLTIGNHIADIFVDSRSYATVHHWIVQRVGSAEIIAWGQEHTFEGAETAARDCLNSLANKL